MHTLDNSYQPYVSTACGVDTIQDLNDQTPVRFPDTSLLPGNISTNASFFLNGTPGRDYPLLQKAQILELAGSKRGNKFKWIHLSSDYYNPPTLGLAILREPLENISDPTSIVQEAMFCTIQAGWGLSTISVSSGGSFTSRVTSTPKIRTPSDVRGTTDEYSNLLKSGTYQQSQSYFESQQMPLAWESNVYPSIPITITPEWAEYINPTLHPDDITILDLALPASEYRDEVSNVWLFTQEILSLLMANAISRVSFDSTFQGNPKELPDLNGTIQLDGNAWLFGKQNFFTVDPQDSKNWTEFTVTSTLKGYAYNTYGFGPKVAIAFLLFYCTIALMHIIYSGISGTFQPCLE